MLKAMLVLLCAGVCFAGDLPIQIETGGGAESPPAAGSAGKSSEFDVKSDGAEGMKAFLFVPEGVVPGRRYPLLFTLHGNGDGGKGRHGAATSVSTKEYPVFVVGIQYQKKVEFNAELWPADVTFRAFDWLLEKTMKEQPIDPDQVYCMGFSMGCGYTGSWGYRRWKTPETFPFRSLFFVGSPANAGRKEAYPPIPYINIVGEKETAVLGTINVVASVREFCMELARFGQAYEYHEIPGMGHGVNEQCHKIIRDTMKALCGPGDPQLSPETGELGKAVTMLRAGRYKEGMEAIKPLVEAKDKKAVEVKKRCESWAGPELKRLESVIAEALVRRKFFEVEAYSRMKLIMEVFVDQGKPYVDKIKNLEKKNEAEIRRRDEFLAARAKEQEDQPAAKAMYQELAKAKDSRTAKAAAFRLSWWTDAK